MSPNVSCILALFMCCPGTYNNAFKPAYSGGVALQTECTACPAHTTTSVTGSKDVTDCNMCVVGFGGPDCATECGGIGTSASYGKEGMAAGALCTACPNMAKGYFFTYAPTGTTTTSGHPYTPYVVSRIGATSTSDCLAEFSQIADESWYLWYPELLHMIVVDVPGADKDAQFENCVARCKPGPNGDCQFATFDYTAAMASSQCWHKITPIPLPTRSVCSPDGTIASNRQ